MTNLKAELPKACNLVHSRAKHILYIVNNFNKIVLIRNLTPLVSPELRI